MQLRVYVAPKAGSSRLTGTTHHVLFHQHHEGNPQCVLIQKTRVDYRATEDVEGEGHSAARPMCFNRLHSAHYVATDVLPQ